MRKVAIALGLATTVVFLWVARDWAPLFSADPDPSGFGEGETYLVTRFEGGVRDLDTGTGTYGPGPINGIS